MKNYEIVNIDSQAGGGLEVLFPGWEGSKEHLLVYSPHDDDAIIGENITNFTLPMKFAETALLELRK